MARRSFGDTGQRGYQSGDTSGFQVSGDTSSVQFSNWFVQTQSFGGMWKLVTVYDALPTPAANGVVSGCPQVAYTYYDLYADIIATGRIVAGSFASGYGSLQEVAYTSDSDAGGFGVSGDFETCSASVRRRLWSGETAYNQSVTTNFQVGKSPGPYDASKDTSGTINGKFMNDFVLKIPRLVPEFQPNLVDM